MPLAQLQCFCGNHIGLSAPANSFSRASTLPQEYTAKCPCGRNWRIVLSQRNPSYRPGRALSSAGASSSPAPSAGEGRGEGD